MPIIFIRHSNDESDDCSKLHDCQLNHDGHRLAVKVGRRLFDLYGIPNIIYCSPFRRTIQTMDSMLSSIDDKRKYITIYKDGNISRYFSRNEKIHPDIDPLTGKSNIPIYESYEEFKYRVKRFIRSIEHYARSEKVVWVITHALVYKQIAYFYDAKIPHPIPFMHYIYVGKDVGRDVSHNRSSNTHGHQCPRCGKYKHY